MKKQSNIAALKELVNNNALERVELYTRGVQAYYIAEGEEYAVVIAYAKQGGRYYFIDREGRRFLVSRYDRAEFVAGEMLEVIANESAAATNAADQVAASVKAYAAKGAKRCAFCLSLLAAIALAFVVVFGTVWITGALCDAFSISAAARVVFALFVLFGPALELAVNIECNFLAVIDRLFPGSFSYPIPFEIFSFWGRLLRA